MTGMKIWGIIRAILPTKKIGAWILGILGAVVALILGVSNTDLKEQFCATKEVVELPKIEVQAPAALPVEATTKK
jgi:hypothetical protein